LGAYSLIACSIIHEAETKLVLALECAKRDSVCVIWADKTNSTLLYAATFRQAEKLKEERAEAGGGQILRIKEVPPARRCVWGD